MPLTIEPGPYMPERAPNAVRWNIHQCRAMQDAGILSGRHELIEGEIILMVGQGPRHAYIIVTLTAWLIALFGAEYTRFQLPIRLLGSDRDSSEPEPDAVVLSRPASDFLDATPEASDVCLAIEVSDSTLRFDRSTKAALYARNLIPEYWIIDIERRQVYMHRTPGPAGYADVMVFSASEQIATLARPDAPVAVADILPPESCIKVFRLWTCCRSI